MITEKELEKRGQGHLLRHIAELNGGERAAFLKQISEIDWETLALSDKTAKRGEIRPIEGLTLEQIAERREEFSAVGREAVAQGKVAAVLLAGGQGTRLGSDAPKGTFNIGVTRPLYIFEQQIENLKTVCRECGAYVPLLVMTSEKNDTATREFFAEHAYFGYPAEYVRFFVQAMSPCVDLEGKILLESRGKLSLSPNGNGGWYSSLERAGLLSDRLLCNTEWFNVYGVDNVLQRIADPVFLGATIESGKLCGAKVVRKCAPAERVGVLCLQDGLPSVVEYYELDEETARLRDERGDLVYSYGVILNYLFNAKKLREIAAEKIPVHAVKKKIPYLAPDGSTVTPAQENGWKFETLILDMVRLMGSCLPFEVEREREFAPIKNRTGTDSVDTARDLLRKNGVNV